ncbi:MAG: ATP-binding cassette domain-containing protein [Eubacterium sp.]|nr:ATP-binding cassette domain-containing protein [Eubacterium sp.]
MNDIGLQMKNRDRLDREKIRRGYERLAASVSDENIVRLFGADDLEMADGAIRACLRYSQATPGDVPEDIADLEERIDYMCRPGGVMHRTVRLESGWYKDAFGAYLGKLHDGEVVALLPGASGGYFYRDPVTGKDVKLNKMTENLLESRAEVFYPTLPPRSLEVREFIQFLFQSLDKGDIIKVIVSAVISALVGLFPALASSLAYGEVAPSGQARLILPIAGLLLGVAVGTLLFQMNKNLVMNRIAIKIGEYAEAAVYARVLLLPTSFFKDYSAGNLATRINNIWRMINAMVSGILGGGLTLVLSVIYFEQIIYYAPDLLPIAVLIIAAQVLVIALILRQLFKREVEVVEANTKASGTVTTLLSGIQKIKLAGAEDRAFAKWADRFSEYARAAFNRPKYLYCMDAFVVLIGMLGTLGIYLKAMNAGYSTADFMAFNTAFGQINAAIVLFTGMIASMVRAYPKFGHLSPILRAAPECDDDKPSVKDVDGSIRVNGVSFRYSEDMPWVLDNVSFSIRPGEYVAIVGRSGCGKSTLMRLLLGFEKPNAGNIMYGEYDLSCVNLRSIRQKGISMVMQDARLLKGDIYENITLANPKATLEDAWEAAEIAGIAKDIREMPLGMNTLVSEGGGGVSGGQRQRLIIARAVCSGRRIMILDEATSALDNITQQAVAESLDRLKCTRIAIAHRLSTVQHCDRILVLDRGKICEEGTYEELIEKNGVFAELVKKQRLDTES